MRAAVLETSPGTLSIEDVTIDEPARHEVLIRTAAAGLCHSDLHFIEGSWPCPLPAVLGHESAGVVEAVGEDVTYVCPGDHVITCLSTYCGQCTECLTGRLYICTNSASTTRSEGAPRLSRDGAPVFPLLKLASFAEQMLVHQNSIVKIDPDMPLDRAALIGCAVTTGLGAVFNTARVEPGSTVAVLGCGGVGLNVVQGARLAGAGRIVAIDLNSNKLELAQEFGATDVIDAGSDDATAELIELTKGGADHVFEAIGLKQTIEMAFPMTRVGGDCTLIGMSPLGTKVEFDATAFLYDRRVQGSMMGSNRFRVDMPRYVDLYLQGRLRLDELVSERIGLDDINEGFAAMKTGNVARSVIVF